MSGIDCYIGKDELDDNDGDSRDGFGDDEDDEEGDFEKFEDKGCRTSSGSKGSAGREYDLYKNISKNRCKGKCIGMGFKCFGWEYSAGGKCEVWVVPIDEDELARVRDLDCYIKF